MKQQIRYSRFDNFIWTVGDYETATDEQGDTYMDSLLIEVECYSDKSCPAFRLNVLDDHLDITYQELLSLRKILNDQVCLDYLSDVEQEKENKRTAEKLLKQTRENIDKLENTTGHAFTSDQLEKLMQARQILNTI